MAVRYTNNKNISNNDDDPETKTTFFFYLNSKHVDFYSVYIVNLN